MNSSHPLEQPEIHCPPGIEVTVLSYSQDHRVTLITFANNGNKQAPTKMNRAALLPLGMEKPAILQMAPDITWYDVPEDNVVEKISVTMGELKIGETVQEALIAVIDIVSVNDGHVAQTHFCARFE